MTIKNRIAAFMGAAAGATLLLGAGAMAQSYPDRPIRLIVPFAAGGTSDAFARTYSPHISAALGQNVVVENMPGAGGAVAAAYLAQQDPDGYVVMLATPGTQITNPLLQANLPYDPDADFDLLASVLEAPNVLVVPSSSPAQNVADLIQMAKDAPGELMFSSAGIGATSHLSGELFGIMAGVDVEHVPYKGSGEAMPDVVAGRIDFTIDTLSTVLPFVRSGEMRALAVTTLEEHSLMPGIPPLSETLPGYLSSAINYIVAPDGVSPEIIALWNAKSDEVMASEAMQARMAEMGIGTYAIPLDELKARITAERAKWGDVIKAAGIEIK